MPFLVGACLAFVLYGIYDINSVLWKSRFLHSFFALGTLLLALCTLGCLVSQWEECLRRHQPLFVLGLVPGAVGFVLMIYSLFFALPFDETYLHPQQKSPVFDRGMYALCRHPAVLWLCLGYVGLALSWGSPLFTALAVLCGLLDVLYVVFQDCWTFPRTFSDYREYRKSTPFLIPTRESIHTAWRTRK